MFWESVTIHRHPGNPRPLYVNVPSYTSWYCTSHGRFLAHNPKVAGSNPAPATKHFKGLEVIALTPFHFYLTII
jgi:hypothetical protein